MPNKQPNMNTVEWKTALNDAMAFCENNSLEQTAIQMARDMLKIKELEAIKKHAQTSAWLVTWTIDVNAFTPRDAAEHALRIQRDAGSIATFFTVQRHGDDQSFPIDLSSPDC